MLWKVYNPINPRKRIKKITCEIVQQTFGSDRISLNFLRNRLRHLKSNNTLIFFFTNFLKTYFFPFNVIVFIPFSHLFFYFLLNSSIFPPKSKPYLTWYIQVRQKLVLMRVENILNQSLIRTIGANSGQRLKNNK